MRKNDLEEIKERIIKRNEEVQRSELLSEEVLWRYEGTTDRNLTTANAMSRQ